MKQAHTEIDNVRAALEWALSGADPNHSRIGAQIAIAMKRLWDLSGYTLEHLNWLERSLANLNGEGEEIDFLRGRLLYALGFNLIYWQNDYKKGKSVMAESIALLRNSLPKAATVLPHALAVLANFELDPEKARSMVEEGAAIGRSSEADDQSSLARSLYWRASFYSKRNDFPNALASVDESLQLSRLYGYIAIEGIAVKVQGDIALRLGDLIVARAYYEKSLPLVREGQDQMADMGIAAILAGIDLSSGEFAAARKRFAENSQTARDQGNESYYFLHRTYTGITAIFEGDYETTGNLLRECLPHIRKSIDDAAVGLAGLAYLASLQADTNRAGRLLGAAAAIIASIGAAFENYTLNTRFSYYRLLEMCRGGYDQAAWEQGYQMTIDQAIDYALQGEG